MFRSRRNLFADRKGIAGPSRLNLAVVSSSQFTLRRFTVTTWLNPPFIPRTRRRSTIVRRLVACGSRIQSKADLNRSNEPDRYLDERDLVAFEGCQQCWSDLSAANLRRYLLQTRQRNGYRYDNRPETLMVLSSNAMPSSLGTCLPTLAAIGGITSMSQRLGVVAALGPPPGGTRG